MFVHASPVKPRVLVAYSQASAYCAQALDRRYAEASEAAIALPAFRNAGYSFVADDQAEAGHLMERRRDLLILPGIDALSPLAGAAYAGAWTNGCTILSDAEAGWRDGHGHRRSGGGMDGLLGIDRDAATSILQPEREPIVWTKEAPAGFAGTADAMPRALSNVAVSGAAVWAAFSDGAPAVAVRTNLAGGRTVWVNTRFEWMGRTDIRMTVRPEDKPEERSANGPVAGLAEWLMDEAGIQSPIQVEPAVFRPALAVAFEDGRARYYGLMTGTNALEAAITLPERAHTYAVREGRYLGCVSQFRDVAGTGAYARVYAQLPYAVSGLRATPDAAVVKSGETVVVRGRVEADGGATEFHVVHAELVKPDGVRPEYGIFNLDAPAGAFSVAYPMALNAPSGEWRVELSDVATGVKTTAVFRVDP